MESVTRGSPTSAPLAHVQNTGLGRFRLHGLDEHLRSVERRAGAFADKFGAGDFGRLAGLWHDLGKFQPAFQSYIRRDSGFDPRGPPGGLGYRPRRPLFGRGATRGGALGEEW